MASAELYGGRGDSMSGTIGDIYRAAVTGHADSLRDLAYGQLLRNRPAASVRTASGTSLSMPDSVGAPLQGLRVFGRSEQVVATGTNLVDFRGVETTANGVTARGDDQGRVTFSGTPTGTTSGGHVITLHSKPVDLSLLSIGQTYRASGFIEYTDNGAKKYGQSFVHTATITRVTVYLQYTMDNYVEGRISYPRLNAGSTTLPWEPYTGGIATPSPEYPQPITSAGASGSITVDVNGRKLTCSAPNGLPGVPVESGGNYTDADGQQWICDEIDLARGVYVQRCVEYCEPPHSVQALTNTVRLNYNYGSTSHIGTSTKAALCSVTSNYFYSTNDTVHFYVEGASVHVYVPLDYDYNANPVQLMCALKIPIERPLTDAELRQLYTSAGGTTITNDVDCYMSAGYYAKI